MGKKNKTVQSSTKEEALMYLLLIVGVAAIVSLFAVNIVLIDKIMGNTIMENHLLRQTLESERKSNPAEEIPLSEDTEDTGDIEETEDMTEDLTNPGEGSGEENQETLPEESTDDLSGMNE